MDNSHAALIQDSLKHIWHPCSQMKDYETFKPLAIARAQGSYIELTNGTKIIDAFSSWWCKSLGHSHPRLKQALLAQIEKFEHASLVNMTNQVIVDLSKKLAALTPSLHKIFYAGDGSCAVEIAMKMSLHAHQILGQSHKNKFIALRNGYHGETAGATSVSDLGIYKDAYRAMLFDVDFIDPPYVNTVDDPLWLDCAEHWRETEKQLAPLAANATAIILEPLIQGAGNMKIYSQDFLRRLRAWTKQHGIHFIADEILTGLGRTGKMLACDYANIEPDFLCLSKGLTAGWLPLSAVLTHDLIYQLFYDDYAKGKSFLHSHTYTGNPLAASVACEVLDILVDENICEKVAPMGKLMYRNMLEIADETKKLTNVRHLGGMVAADLIHPDKSRRLGYEVYQKAIELGAFLRPLGNTLYWFPPLNTPDATLEELKNITRKAILAVTF